MTKIMFNNKYGLTQAVLDGRKTMTRRACKYDRPNETYDIVFPVFEPNDYDNDGNIVSPLNYAFGWKNDKGDFTGWNIPKYKVGEVVAIAQSYSDCGNMPDYELDEDGYPIMPKRSGFFNKMFVRADLMPHHIRITDIKIERLQNISDEDCFKEGIFKWDAGQKDIPFYSFHNADIPDYNDSRDAFAELIDKVSGKGTWASNPYVFVYEFELID
jgi:hypothetical protein|nr:MAG TPA: ASCH domain protein [Caudoviricetes sp.]